MQGSLSSLLGRMTPLVGFAEMYFSLTHQLKKQTNLGKNSINCTAFPAAFTKPNLNHGGAYLVALLAFEVNAQLLKVALNLFEAASSQILPFLSINITADGI